MSPNESITIQPKDTHDAKDAASKLTYMSPQRMKRIGEQMNIRAQIAKRLNDDLTTHALGSDRFHRVMDFKETEGNIVNESIAGLLNDVANTRDLWGKVIVGMGQRVDEERRTQMYVDLTDEKDGLTDQGKVQAIDSILSAITEFDPEISERAANGDYFKSGMLQTESATIKDTFAEIF